MPDPRELVAEMYLQFAEELADASGDAIRPWFRRDSTVERKQDGSPVTQADRGAERAIRERIADRYPRHGVIGEEFGVEQADAEWVWVVDPIDGTGAFVAGLPTFGTLIALLQNGAPLLGVLDQPILRERWSGVDVPQVMARTTHNSHVVHTSSTVTLADCVGFATTPEMFDRQESAAWARLAGSLDRVRYGADCYAYGLLASGYVDIVCEASLKSWDYLALAPIVRGAGGQMTDWGGSALTIESGSQVLAAANASVHRSAIVRLEQVGG
ncbi:MAG: histidinol-phosphatase [Chloroflexi bacterium]|nr:histidinol-phosphatase [Chloroflexota bacterium]MCY3697280.1 histidinol-phosphatase [Chloroflexota bacterium]MXX32060.1 histidinol-phosphatase [Chloroflexota bacterium]MYD17825.1 histidinol-phosphatase [Chloroflexota bacterium]MYJ00977.1 histidinol-phosphatase [Chloroflexota bacterium]